MIQSIFFHASRVVLSDFIVCFHDQVRNIGHQSDADVDAYTMIDLSEDIMRVCFESPAICHTPMYKGNCVIVDRMKRYIESFICQEIIM